MKCNNNNLYMYNISSIFAQIKNLNEMENEKNLTQAEFIQEQLARTKLTKYGMAKAIGMLPNHFSQLGGKKNLTEQVKQRILNVKSK